MARVFRRKYPGKKTGKLVAVKSRKTTNYSRRKNVRMNRQVKVGRGFPKQLVMTHKYVDTIGITSSAGILQNFLFSCNGLYDPNITGVGHQPYYYDQLVALYRHYTVIGSKIKVTVIPDATNTSPTYFGIYINDDTSSAYSEARTVSEYQQGAVKIIPQDSGLRPIVVTKKWSAKKQFGGSVLGNDQLKGTSAANPFEQEFFNLICQATQGGTNSLQCYVEITYIAVWREVVDVGES